jgi:hypothetical protein
LLQRWITKAGHRYPWAAHLAGLALLALLGLAAGLLAARYGLLVPLATLAGLSVGVSAFFFPWAGLLIALAFAILLPFAVLPVSLGLTPSFLELALLGTLAGWVLPPLLRGDRRWRFSLLDALAWALLALSALSLILGWGRGVDATVLHNYVKLLLGLCTFFAVRQLTAEPERRRQFVSVLLLAAGLAALLGLVLHALPNRSALNLLVQLGPLGYPTEGRVLRFVEDNPDGLERAVSTSVDPNSFGGMLALAGAVALGEVLARWQAAGKFRLPIPRSRGPAAELAQKGWRVPFPVLALILTLVLVCLYLTYSRAALGGFAVAAVFLVAARYHRLWWGVLAVVVLVAALVVVLGPDHPVVERFRQGLAFQDLANRMRLSEFANAWAIVQRYPALGVGFGNAPDVDLSTGVSSLYLTIAERMGLAGLVAFLAFVGTALWQALRLCRGAGGEDAGQRLALLAGVVAALAIGLLDHYFFNPEFPHMATLLWATLGLATVAPSG